MFYYNSKVYIVKSNLLYQIWKEDGTS